MPHQECPSCMSRRYEPPGPCDALDQGEVCGYREPERPPVKSAPGAPRIPAGGYRLRPVSEVGGEVDPKPYLADARAALARAVEAKKAS